MATGACKHWQGHHKHACTYTPARSSGPHMYAHPGEIHDHQSHTCMYTPERYTAVRATRACTPRRGTRSSEPHVHVHPGEVQGTRIHKGRWPARSHTRKSLSRTIVTSRPQWHGNDNHTRLLGRWQSNNTFRVKRLSLCRHVNHPGTELYVTLAELVHRTATTWQWQAAVLPTYCQETMFEKHCSLASYHNSSEYD